LETLCLNSFETKLVSSNIDCLLPPIVFSKIKRNLIVLANFVHQSTYVNKNVLLAFIIQDEAKTFSFIEKFYFAC
jgi:hypothetical protein